MQDNVIDLSLTGGWYPAQADELRAAMNRLLTRASAPALDTGPIRALLLPHAGLQWSGPVAAQALAHLPDRPCRRVVILAPAHRRAAPGRILLPGPAPAAITPLGTIPLDQTALTSLRHSLVLAEDDPATHDQEHAIAVLLPWLQHLLDDWLLVPLLLGQLEASQHQQVADAVRPLLDEDSLLIISSDFTHHGAAFGYQPCRDNLDHGLQALDQALFTAAFDPCPTAWSRILADTGATVCGRDAIAVLRHLMFAPQARIHVHHCAYDHSARRGGGDDHAVGYHAAVCTGHWAPAHGDETMLDPVARNQALAVARHAIATQLGRPAPDPRPLKPVLQQVMGAFVSLHHQGRLRGCIGEISARRPLAEALAARAVDAACHDPRFPPLTAEELDQVEIEISALHPPTPVAGPEDIILGRHGIILEHSGHHAVFLPQVAPQQGWDLNQTLDHLSRKAGLTSGAWQEPHTRLSVFTAEVFDERS